MAELIDISDRHRHGFGARPPQVMSLREVARLANIHVATLYRRLRDGTGPRITVVTPGRKGVTDSDYAAWIEGCAK